MNIIMQYGSKSLLAEFRLCTWERDRGRRARRSGELEIGLCMENAGH